MGKPVVIFRADGHAEMGLGHLIRSAALAEMLAPDFACYFAYRHCPAGLSDQIAVSCSGTHLLESDEPTEFLRYAEGVGNGPVIVVLDGYHFGTAYQRSVIDAGHRLVCIDDIHAYHFLAHVVINHAGGIRPEDYSAEAYTRFCLGPRYALLRKAFRDTSPVRAALPNKSGFVCLGGADPPNATLTVLEECGVECPDYTLDVVIGAAYAHRDVLDQYLAASNARVRLHHGVSAEEMARLMADSDFGITSPSTVSFEYLSVGGTLYLLPIADNQADIYAYFVSGGLAFSFEDDFPVSQDRILGSREKRALLFDGNIQHRYRQLFTELAIR
ncbi:UDP-2,4-diacetamido-2,4,6-trideoxy-beta-L-altropyranose hydrolase [Lewinella sp. JB7]|uniref:UDP-2,4-diacetamido-2,4, 6-trideoxy-beta-L-altropyranose hydrolase n=1 Tax=Lewinella sp. JB7 TaxID=2962887 RepID=UPI0020C98DB7|nr:UDP-2,4-diacetamido-2,4,6-trideoxy-beta-L-altropyranose hydrolase [Lewinella sp. JB7]